MLYSFDDCLLDTDRRELKRGGAAVELEPQVFDLLAYLIRERERVVTRDDILAAVWQGRIVSESTLGSRINAARAAIGDDGTAQRLIRTLARKGVRFVGEVREEKAQALQTSVPAAPPQVSTAAAAAAGAGGTVHLDLPAGDWPAIAVLPFTNMSGDSETDYFADGMTEEIITALARCGGILVIARNSSFTYKGEAVDIRRVGRELNVGYVLEGSVRRSQDRLRITAQLIETQGGTHIWADRFDGNFSDVFELQDRIAETAAAVIEPKLRYTEAERVRRRPPQNLDAYEWWLRAISYVSEFTPESMAAALDCCDRAIALDPAFSLAMASAAYYHAHCNLQGWVEKPDRRRAKSIRMAYEAVEIAKDDSNVLWQGAFALWSLEQNHARAVEWFRRSLAVNPNNAMALALAGWVEAAGGDPARGRQLLERSQRLNPRHPRGWFVWTGMAVANVVDARYEEAIAWAEKALAQNRRFGVALRILAVSLVNVGKLDRAREIVAEARRVEPDLTVSIMRRRLPPNREAVVDLYCESLRKAGLPD